jgi:hypothetical protein
MGLGYELTVMPFPPRYRAKEFAAEASHDRSRQWRT